MTTTQEALKDEDISHLEKHAREYHGLTVSQFILMCEEADKRYEGKFSHIPDKVLAVEAFNEGFKVAVKALEQQEQEPVAWLQKYENQDGEIKHTVTDEQIGVNDIPVYTHPAKQLSDDEITSLKDAAYVGNEGIRFFDYLIFARSIEAKIRGE